MIWLLDSMLENVSANIMSLKAAKETWTIVMEIHKMKKLLPELHSNTRGIPLKQCGRSLFDYYCEFEGTIDEINLYHKPKGPTTMLRGTRGCQILIWLGRPACTTNKESNSWCDCLFLFAALLCIRRVAHHNLIMIFQLPCEFYDGLKAQPFCKCNHIYEGHRFGGRSSLPDKDRRHYVHRGRNNHSSK